MNNNTALLLVGGLALVYLMVSRASTAATLPYATGANAATGGGLQYNPQTGFSFAIPTTGLADILGGGGAGASGQPTGLGGMVRRSNVSRWTV